MTTIEKFLQDTGARVDLYQRWLLWDSVVNEWVVREQPYRARQSRCLYSGPDLEEALRALQGDTMTTTLQQPPKMCPRQCLTCRALGPHRQSACRCTCWKFEATP